MAAIVVMITVTAARADQIDGTWCSAKGESMSVDGTRITTPGGKTVIGYYDRHNIEYEVPEGEPNAGGRVKANQLHDELIRVTKFAKGQKQPGPVEEWTPCKPVS